MRKRRLGDICLPTEVCDPTRNPSALFRYIDISAIDNKRKEITAARELRGAEAPSRARKRIRTGDIILATTRPNLNAVAIIPQELDNQVCSTGFCVLRPSESIDRDYLFFYSISQQFISGLNDLTRGALYPAVSDKQVFDQLIPLPDLPTQRRVAARLKAQLTEVEAARKAAVAAKADSDKLLDHCLREVFQNIVPLSTNPLNPVTPKGWRWAPLMELARLESGHTPSRRHPEYWENGDIPWLALPDIRALDCRVAVETIEQTNQLGIKNSSARVCPEQTVAMCRTASVGYVTILGRPMATSQHFTNWICGEALMPRFLMWLIRASRRFTKSIASGSILPDIYMNVVHNFHVCLPAIETQEKIVARIDAVQAELDQLSNRQNEQLEALNKLPAAYLREAFSEK